MASLRLGLHLGILVTFYALLSEVSAETVVWRVSPFNKDISSKGEVVAIMGDYSHRLIYYNSEETKQYCLSLEKDNIRGEFYVELFYKDTRIDSFCSLAKDSRLKAAVQYFCHFVGGKENEHLFDLNWNNFEKKCTKVKYSVEEAAIVGSVKNVNSTESRCEYFEGWLMEMSCLMKNGVGVWEMILWLVEKKWDFKRWEDPVGAYDTKNSDYRYLIE